MREAPARCSKTTFEACGNATASRSAKHCADAATERRIVKLDVVHGDDAALLADLERRLGGQVRRLLVCEVDYVRDVTVVDVRYRVAGQAAAPPRAADPVTARGAQAWHASPPPVGVYRGVRVVR
ncbi:MAG: DUF4956 domain-containing protein [Micromonosporaceae bacterium]